MIVENSRLRTSVSSNPPPPSPSTLTPTVELPTEKGEEKEEEEEIPVQEPIYATVDKSKVGVPAVYSRTFWIIMHINFFGVFAIDYLD